MSEFPNLFGKFRTEVPSNAVQSEQLILNYTITTGSFHKISGTYRSMRVPYLSISAAYSVAKKLRLRQVIDCFDASLWWGWEGYGRDK